MGGLRAESRGKTFVGRVVVATEAAGRETRVLGGMRVVCIKLMALKLMFLGGALICECYSLVQY